MADLQLIAVAPSSGVGDIGFGKPLEAATEESFDLLLNQAKTTAEETLPPRAQPTPEQSRIEKEPKTRKNKELKEPETDVPKMPNKRRLAESVPHVIDLHLAETETLPEEIVLPDRVIVREPLTADPETDTDNLKLPDRAQPTEPTEPTEPAEPTEPTDFRNVGRRHWGFFPVMGDENEIIEYRLPEVETGIDTKTDKNTRDIPIKMLRGIHFIDPREFAQTRLTATELEHIAKDPADVPLQIDHTAKHPVPKTDPPIITAEKTPVPPPIIEGLGRAPVLPLEEGDSPPPDTKTRKPNPQPVRNEDSDTGHKKPLPEALPVLRQTPIRTPILGREPKPPIQGGLSIEEAANSLPLRSEAIRGSEGMDSQRQVQRIQPEAVAVRPPQAPLIIELALPRQNTGERAAIQTFSNSKEAVSEGGPAPSADVTVKVNLEGERDERFGHVKDPGDSAGSRPSDNMKFQGDNPKETPKDSISPQNEKSEWNIQVKTEGDSTKQDRDTAQKDTPARAVATAREEKPAQVETGKNPSTVADKHGHEPDKPTVAEKHATEPTQAQTTSEKTNQPTPQPARPVAKAEALKAAQPEHLSHEIPAETKEDIIVKQAEGEVFRAGAKAGREPASKVQSPSDSNSAPKKFSIPHNVGEVSHAPSSTSQQTPSAAQPLLGAAPKLFLPPQAPMAQMEGSVKWLLNNGVKSAEVQLHPENLGRVTVQLRVEGSEVHARIWATEATTLPLLKVHRAFLESSLKEQGLNLSSFDLQQGRGGQQTEGNSQRQNQHFGPPMSETWTGAGFRQDLPIQLMEQPADEGGIELYA